MSLLYFVSHLHQLQCLCPALPVHLPAPRTPCALLHRMHRRDTFSCSSAFTFACLLSMYELSAHFIWRRNDSTGVVVPLACLMIPALLAVRDDESSSIRVIKFYAAMCTYFYVFSFSCYSFIFTHGATSLALSDVYSPGDMTVLHTIISVANFAMLHHTSADATAWDIQADRIFVHVLAASYIIQLASLLQDLNLSWWCLQHRKHFSVRPWSLADVFGLKIRPWDHNARVSAVHSMLCAPLSQFVSLKQEDEQQYWNRSIKFSGDSYLSIFIGYLRAVPLSRSARYIVFVRQLLLREAPSWDHGSRVNLNTVWRTCWAARGPIFQVVPLLIMVQFASNFGAVVRMLGCDPGAETRRCQCASLC